ncbi:hypothetical protein HDU81_000812 [Chytriomyces hyalinus]|nr:hypothetical protein HDU81_000812 [Chytriomyces hyalinus]
MRADVTTADMTAFCIAAFMLAVMVMTLLLLITVVFRSTHQNMTPSSTAGQSKVNKTPRAYLSIFTVFNASLLGIVVGSATLFVSHSYYTVRGASLLESFGGTLFESCYCIYTWYRSISLIGESGTALHWILTGLASLNLILFTTQLITAVLFECQSASIQFYEEVAVATIAGMFLLDVGMLWSFINFLVKNPAPTSSTGQFNGNSEAQKQWNRTSIIAKYGAFSCGASFLALTITVGSRLVPSLNPSLNLMNACAYSAAASCTIILLVMKIKLEGGYGLFGSAVKSEFASTAKSEDYMKVVDEEV